MREVPLSFFLYLIRMYGEGAVTKKTDATSSVAMFRGDLPGGSQTRHIRAQKGTSELIKLRSLQTPPPPLTSLAVRLPRCSERALGGGQALELTGALWVSLMGVYLQPMVLLPPCLSTAKLVA